MEKGNGIITDKDYLENTFLVFYEFGFKLGQTIFRKLFGDKASLGLIDNSLIHIGYDLLRFENWLLALKVFEFAKELKSAWISDDRSKKIFVINNAIALKNSGNNEGVLKLFDQIDWSSASAEFALAVKVLREEYGEAERLMSMMDGMSPVNEDGFRDWPLFKEFRKTEQFARAFNKIYEKEFDGLPSEQDIREIYAEK